MLLLFFFGNCTNREIVLLKFEFVRWAFLRKKSQYSTTKITFSIHNFTPQSKNKNVLYYFSSVYFEKLFLENSLITITIVFYSSSLLD